MSVSGIEAGGFSPYVAPRVDPSGTAGGSAAARSASPAEGADFGNLVLEGIQRLDGVQRQSDGLAVQAATGDLQSIHDYTIAATQAAVTTQVTVAVRNKAVEAFTEIMRMQA